MRTQTAEIIRLENEILRLVDNRAVVANGWSPAHTSSTKVGFEERSSSPKLIYPPGVFSIDHHGRMRKDPLRGPEKSVLSLPTSSDQISPWLWRGLTCTTTIVAYLLLFGHYEQLPQLHRDYSETLGDDLDQVLSASLWSASQVFENRHALIATFILNIEHLFEALIDEEFMIRPLASEKRRELPPNTSWRARLYCENSEQNKVLFIDIGTELVSIPNSAGSTWHDQIRGIAALMGLDDGHAAVTIVRSGFQRSDKTQRKSQLTVGGFGNFREKWYLLTPETDDMIGNYSSIMTELALLTDPQDASSRNMLARLKPSRQIRGPEKYSSLEETVLSVLESNGYKQQKDTGTMSGCHSVE